MKNKIFILFIVMILVSQTFVLMAQESSNNAGVSQNNNVAGINPQNMQLVTDESTGITTFTFISEDSTIKLGPYIFSNVEPSSETAKSYITTDENGKIIEADLMARSDLKEEEYVTWTLNGETLRVPAGTRVLSKDGKIRIIHNSKVDSFQVKKDGANEFARIYPVKYSEIEINKDWIEGKDFMIDVSPGFSPKIKGGIRVMDQAILMKQGSLAEYGGMNLVNKDELLLAVSEESYNSPNFKNKLLIDREVKGEGEGYSVNFGEQNQFARFDSKEDVFGIDMVKDAKFSLTNRDQLGKIPLLKTDGEVIIKNGFKDLRIELDDKGDYRTILNLNHNLANSGLTFSPIEFAPTNSRMKYIFSNFGGIATVPLNVEEGVTDERYSQSIYFQRASTDLRYNYPKKEDFEEISGAKLVLIKGQDESPLDNPKNIRRLIDFYETLPEESKKNFHELRFYSSEEYHKLIAYGENSVAHYNPLGNYIGMQDLDINEGYVAHGLDVFRHEYTHLQSHAISTSLKFNFEWQKVAGTIKEEVPTGLDAEGNVYPPGSFLTSFISSQELLDSNKLSEHEFEWKDRPWGPYAGYVTPYGAVSSEEDLATYVQFIVANPAFFKSEGLITPGNKNYDPRYKQKIDLLLKNGFISKVEYDSVFHP